jgi:cytochrome P450
MSLPSGPSLTDNAGSQEDLLESFFANPFDFLKHCQDTYGDVFTVPLGDFGVDEYAASGQWVFLTHPEHIKALFGADTDTCVGGQANDIQFMQLMPRAGSVVIDGPEHIERRRALGDLVVGKQKLNRFTTMMEAEATKSFEQAERTTEGHTLQLASVFRELSNNIMERASFGNDTGSDTEEIKQHLNHFGDIGATPTDKQAIIGRCLAKVDSYIDTRTEEGCPVAQESFVAPNSPDAVSYLSLFAGLSADSERWQSLPQAALRDELVTMLLGGADTTATTLSWVLAWLVKNPEVMETLVAEVDGGLGDKSLAEQDIESLPFLDAVVKESSRISPMLFNSSARLLKQPLTLGGYKIPAGTMVANCAYLVHHRADIYSAPERFMPQRFLDSKPNPYQWIPFGGGVRRCIGMGFAIHEIKIALATLLRSYVLQDEGVSTQAEMQGSFFGPAGGVPVRLVRR